MPIYLYVKTHTDTGLKYLGKTSSKDPHKYPGSGKYWQRHLKAHGFTYTTEILKECDHPDEIKFWGQHYSDLWNVVESDEWANLKPETGVGGSIAHTPEARAKIKEARARQIITPESIAKGVATRKANGTNARTPEAIAKGKATLAERGGFAHTTETKEKMIATRKTNGTNANGPAAKSKRKATMDKNGTTSKHPHTPETKARLSEISRAWWAAKKASDLS